MVEFAFPNMSSVLPTAYTHNINILRGLRRKYNMMAKGYRNARPTASTFITSSPFSLFFFYVFGIRFVAVSNVVDCGM